MVQMPRIWALGLVVWAMHVCLSAASHGPGPSAPILPQEESVTVHGSRIPCIAAVPFFVRDAEGWPVQELRASELTARVSWYGEEVELPVLQVQRADERARVTFLMDTTWDVMDFGRREILDFVTSLVAGLELEDEVRFINVDEHRGIDDITGFVSLRDLYKGIGGFCARDRESGGACGPVTTQADAEDAVDLALHALIRRGYGDVNIWPAYEKALESRERSARNAIVVVSDFVFKCCCGSRPMCCNPRGFLQDEDNDPSDSPPLSVFFVIPSATIPGKKVLDSHPLMDVGVRETYDLWPGNAAQVASRVLQRIPTHLVATVDASGICGRVHKCVLVRLETAGPAAEGGYELTAERCVPVETPSSLARRIRDIKDPVARAEFVRAAAAFRESPSARYFAEGLREALEKEKDPEVLRAMEEVLAELE